MRLLSLLLLPLLSAPTFPAFHLSGVAGAESLSSQVVPSDSVGAWMATGRFWHAARLLRERRTADSVEDLGSTLLLAEAEGGWGNWVVVRSLLAEPLQEGRLAGAEAWYLLGRAWEAEEGWSRADSAYSRALEALRGGGGGGALAEEMVLRRARARGRSGEYREALGQLRGLSAEMREEGEWMAVELAREAAGQGAVEETLSLLSFVERGDVRRSYWDLPARALLAAQDSAGAEAAYWSALPALTAAGRARGWERVGALRLARGDSSGARAAFHRVLEEDASAESGLAAARRLLILGFDSASVALAGAEALARAGDNREALGAYGTYETLLGEAPRPPVQLARARVSLAAGQAGEALGLLAPLVLSQDSDVGGAALALRGRALLSLGRGGEARRAQDELVERFPQRPEAVEVLFNRAVALQSGGDVAGALRGFRTTAELSPSQNLAGEARMREAQILLSLGRKSEAIEVYRGYLESFPEGRRWDQAAFWAGRTLLEQGRREEGTSLLEELRNRLALSYYAVQASRLLQESFRPPIPPTEEELPFPVFLRDGLARVDLLEATGLEEGVAWEVDRLTREARAVPGMAERQGTLLRLAHELNGRGLTREGINLGWEVQREGRPWDSDLLAAIYPFPYRDLVMAEARERSLDPFLMAGLIRQESAFWAQARSRADARGLMQVLPATGADLARSVGPQGFRADAHLYRPEINLHLGMAFFRDLERRFGGDLSILLSAYNAGPSRALRWREFPEAGDLPRFVERIPFDETRGYVKAVTLNREIYAWLYGEGGGLP